MKTKQINLDFSNITSLEEMHSLLKYELSLPEFYGGNINALIDCLSSLRYPQDEMIGIALGQDESLVLKTKSMSSLNEICLNHFLISIENANRLEESRGRKPSIELIAS